MIIFEKVNKKFPDGTTALTNLSFEIGDGEFVFLVGPSGAGKTSILRLIIRELSPTSGQITVDEHALTKISGSKITQLRRKIGVVFQDLKLLADRSVFENVALSLWVLGKTKKEVDEQVAEKLALVGLSAKSDFFPAQLSGGELQRVAIARALAGDPKYLLADEPTGNVDDANAWKIVKILDKINKSGITVVMATHNTEIVDTLNKRVLRLEDGHIISDKKGKYH
ncbi:MAG: cell division ATP-binding protein FtsE [Patescibacteria group bacterium]|nr:cell division ATP-binding protein FtsE [Patescibacteria group bacterium]MCL5431494.1 cell division ATP-binding protein FtsE [Patescibacteria group bacterium]